MKRTFDTLVILGSHPDTRGEFDWSRARECDIWVFNEAVSIGKWVQHATGVFQMHVPAIWRNPANRNDSKHAEWLGGGQTPPIYMQKHYDDVPMSVEYPLDAVIANLLPGFKIPLSKSWNNRGGFFNSSLDYAMALGIYLDYPRIEIYGCELALNTEYIYQRPGFTFWTGVALGRGIVIDYHGSVYDAPLYGYEGDLVIQRKVFDDRVNEMRHLCKEATLTYNARKDAMQAALQQLIERKKTAEETMASVVDALRASQVYAMYDGALQENERYIKKLDAMINESGEFRFSRTEFEQAKNNYYQRREDAIKKANIHALAVEQAFREIDKAEGFKKRTAAADEFVHTFDDQVTLTASAAGYDKAAAENIRYMHMLDELYKAAGGRKSVEVLEKLNGSPEQLRNPG